VILAFTLIFDTLSFTSSQALLCSDMHIFVLDIDVTWSCMPSRNDYLAAKIRAWNRVAASDALLATHLRGKESDEQPFSPPTPDKFAQLNLAQRWSYFRHLVNSEMKWHGLMDGGQRWKVAYSHSRTCAGTCAFTSKTLSFSRHLIARGSPEQMRDTVPHEIAHALAGPRHCHSSKWREIALRIGCNGERCHNMDLAPPKWIYRCSAGCWQRPRFKRSHLTAKHTCKQCRAKCVYVHV
jgi:predicted SprT family Zn-dependent metalloprotease